jgi:hypothetical protein
LKENHIVKMEDIVLKEMEVKEMMADMFLGNIPAPKHQYSKSQKITIIQGKLPHVEIEEITQALQECQNDEVSYIPRKYFLTNNKGKSN